MEQAPDFSRIARRALFGREVDSSIPGAGTSAAKHPRRHTKVKVTINLDGDIINFFKERAAYEDLGYQILINRALREYMEGNQSEQLAKEIAELLLHDDSFLEHIAAKLDR